MQTAAYAVAGNRNLRKLVGKQGDVLTRRMAYSIVQSHPATIQTHYPRQTIVVKFVLGLPDVFAVRLTCVGPCAGGCPYVLQRCQHRRKRVIVHLIVLCQSEAHPVHLASRATA